MRLLGANIISVKQDAMSLKEAVDQAFAAYQQEYETAFIRYRFNRWASSIPYDSRTFSNSNRQRSSSAI